MTDYPPADEHDFQVVDNRGGNCEYGDEGFESDEPSVSSSSSRDGDMIGEGSEVEVGTQNMADFLATNPGTKRDFQTGERERVREDEGAALRFPPQLRLQAVTVAVASALELSYESCSLLYYFEVV